MDKLDLNSVFEELNAINDEEAELTEVTHPYAGLYTDPDYRILETCNPWWFTSRCYYEYVDKSETRWQAADLPSDKVREKMFQKAKEAGRIKSTLLKVLYHAARRPNGMNVARNKGGVSSTDAIDMANAVLEKLAL